MCVRETTQHSNPARELTLEPPHGHDKRADHFECGLLLWGIQLSKRRAEASIFLDIERGKLSLGLLVHHVGGIMHRPRSYRNSDRVIEPKLAWLEGCIMLESCECCVGIFMSAALYRCLTQNEGGRLHGIKCRQCDMGMLGSDDTIPGHVRECIHLSARL